MARASERNPAILLAEALDTTPEFWMGLQADFDLWHALKARTAVSQRRGRPGPGRHRAAWPLDALDALIYGLAMAAVFAALQPR